MWCDFAAHQRKLVIVSSDWEERVLCLGLGRVEWRDAAVPKMASACSCGFCDEALIVSV